MIMRYTQEAITKSGESLDFPVRCNHKKSGSELKASSMEQVIHLMRQSSAGVNLITRKFDQCLMEGYLHMKKGKLPACCSV